MFGKYVPLENGKNSFDDQFRVIEQMSVLFGSQLVRIGELDPIKIFVGSVYEQYIPAKVLEHSIKKNTHNPVKFNFLFGEGVPNYDLPRDQKNKPRTPFSFQRFLIPSITSGKAFYLDSDMQVFSDMAPLLEEDFGEANVLSCSGMEEYDHWKGSEYAVLMLDCDRIDWDIHSIVKDLDAGKLTYEQLMFDFSVADVSPRFSPTWNSLDTYTDGETDLLHYTDMSTQPWRFGQHPHHSVWVDGLKGALEDGLLSDEEYRAHVREGCIRDVLWEYLTVPLP